MTRCTLESLFYQMPVSMQAHSIHVSKYSVAIATHLSSLKSVYRRYSYSNVIDAIEDGGKYHDVGKITAPSQFGGYVPEQGSRLIELHPAYSVKEISHAVDFNSQSDLYKNIVLSMAQYHHESFDGNGYPYHLVGEKIPITAQICAVANTIELLTNERFNSKIMTFSETLNYIIQQQGIKYAPDVVDAMNKARNELFAIYDSINYGQSAG